MTTTKRGTVCGPTLGGKGVVCTHRCCSGDRPRPVQIVIGGVVPCRDRRPSRACLIGESNRRLLGGGGGRRRRRLRRRLRASGTVWGGRRPAACPGGVIYGTAPARGPTRSPGHARESLARQLPAAARRGHRDHRHADRRRGAAGSRRFSARARARYRAGGVTGHERCDERTRGPPTTSSSSTRRCQSPPARLRLLISDEGARATDPADWPARSSAALEGEPDEPRSPDRRARAPRQMKITHRRP